LDLPLGWLDDTREDRLLECPVKRAIRIRGRQFTPHGGYLYD
jgi:hypothetical protein